MTTRVDLSGDQRTETWLRKYYVCIVNQEHNEMEWWHGSDWWCCKEDDNNSDDDDDIFTFQHQLLVEPTVNNFKK